MAALLFACHPTHVEAVAGLVGRADCLCGMLYMMTLIFYTHCHQCHINGHQFTTSTTDSNNKKSINSTNSNAVKTNIKSPSTTAITTSTPVYWLYFLLAHVFALSAAFAKELGVTVYGALVVMEGIQLCPVIFQRKHLSTPLFTTLTCLRKNPSVMSSCLRIQLCVVLVGLLSLFRVLMNGPHILYTWTVLENHVHLLPSLQTRALTYCQTHFWYLFKLIYPRHLSFDYGYACLPTIEAIYDTRNLLPLSAYSVLMSLLFYAVLINWSPALILSVSLVVLPLLPASNLLFPVGTLLAERLLFIPSIGTCLVAGQLLTNELVPYWQYVAKIVYLTTKTISHYRAHAHVTQQHAIDQSKTNTCDTSLLTSINTNSSNGNRGLKTTAIINTTTNFSNLKHSNHINNTTATTTTTTHVSPVRKNQIEVNDTTINDNNNDNEIGEKYAGVALLCLWLLPVVCLCSAGVIRRNNDWRDEASLFASALCVCPLSVKALANHALTQMDAGRGETGALVGETAAALYSHHTAALINSALSYNKITQYNYMDSDSDQQSILFHTNKLEGYIPTTTHTTASTSSSSSSQSQSQQSKGREIKKLIRNEKLLIRSLYTLHRAMNMSDYTSSKSVGYAGSTLHTYIQHLVDSAELYHHLLERTSSEEATQIHTQSDMHVLVQQETKRVVSLLKEIAANQIETSILLGM